MEDSLPGRCSLLGIIGGLMVADNLGDVAEEIKELHELAGIERPEGNFLDGWEPKTGRGSGSTRMSEKWSTKLAETGQRRWTWMTSIVEHEEPWERVTQEQVWQLVKWVKTSYVNVTVMSITVPAVSPRQCGRLFMTLRTVATNRVDGVGIYTRVETGRDDRGTR